MSLFTGIDDIPIRSNEPTDILEDVATSFVRSALLNFNSKKTQGQVIEPTETKATASTKVTFETSADFSVPVVYGDGFVEGAAIDASLNTIAGECVLSVCIVCCEKTGELMSTETVDGDGVSTYEDSVIYFREVYIENKLAIFDTDGVTIIALEDEEGVRETDIAGLIQVFPYNNGSLSPTFMDYVSDTGNLLPAYQVMPGWTPLHTMDELVFAVVKVKYNAEKEMTKFPNITFRLRNTMQLPGDCIWDYLRNTRYGAGLRDEEIAR
jgi:hypothetical protein